MNKIKELYEYRYMLVTLIKQDLLGKYRKSILGILWVLINPLLLLVIYTILFKYIFKIEIDNYPIYLFIGIMGWNLFASSISNGTGSIVSNSGIIKKVYFPREFLPMSILIGNVINYFLCLPIIILGLFICKIGISWYILLLPIIVFVQFVLNYALTILLSAVNVFFRDVEQISGNILFLWMYATPIVYSADMIPNFLKIVFNLNPMLYIINAYRDVLYYKQCFNIKALSIVLVCSVLFLLISQLIFDKLSKKFVEEL